MRLKSNMQEKALALPAASALPVSPPESLDFSVVIPALNEAGSIGPLLDVLASQSRSIREVIVVDAGSTDATRREAEARAERFPSFRLLVEPGAYPGKGRNVGARVAASEWLLFLDCGLSIQPDCVRHLVERQRTSQSDVVFGRIVANTSTFFTECAAVAYVPPSTRKGRPVRRPTAQLQLIRKSVFERIGGFPEHLRSAEDLLFLRKLEQLRVDTSFAPEAVTWWDLAPDLKATFRRFRIYSSNNLLAGLAREWHLRIGAYYLVVGAIGFLASWVAGSPFLIPILFGMFMAIRSIKSVWFHREVQRASFSRRVLQLFLVVVILCTIDAATFIGACDFIWQKHVRSKDR